MPKFDITKLNVAIDRLLESTTNSRHRFLLQAYSRYRYLEVAGRYEEILAPEMMSADPVYHFNQAGIDTAVRGRELVRNLYRIWAETNQSIFFVEQEEVAVADHFIASVMTLYQQVSAKGLKQEKLPSAISRRLVERVLAKNGCTIKDSDVYLYKSVGMQMLWRYDDRGRLLGEDVWESDPSEAKLLKLDPQDVLTIKESARLVAPLIKPLPSFEESVSGRLVAA